MQTGLNEEDAASVDRAAKRRYRQRRSMARTDWLDRRRALCDLTAVLTLEMRDIQPCS